MLIFYQCIFIEHIIVCLTFSNADPYTQAKNYHLTFKDATLTNNGWKKTYNYFSLLTRVLLHKKQPRRKNPAGPLFLFVVLDYLIRVTSPFFSTYLSPHL
jgi:hypothetical protein